MKTLITLAIFGLLVTMPNGYAEAQSLKHKVTPRVIDIEVEPRDIISKVIVVESLAAHKTNVFTSVNTVNVDEGGDITNFTPPSVSNNEVTATSWVEVSGSMIEFAPGETKELPVTFKIHSEAKPGVYHVFIGFGTGTNRDEAEKQVKNGSAPGVIATISVDQNQTEFMKLDNFLIDRFVVTAENNAVSYTLNNPGTATVVPRGEIILSDGTGDEVGAVTVNPDSVVLQPGEEKQFTASVPTAGLMGKYKAFLSVDYGSEQVASVYDTVYFYVMPWKQLTAIFFGILVAVIILTLYFHRRYSVNDDNNDEHGAEYIPLYVRKESSAEKKHDVNLRKN